MGVDDMASEMKQYIYVLKLIPALRDAGNWTQNDEQIVDRHFAHLQGLLKENRLILAGKTEGLDEKTFGIVILEAESDANAAEMVKRDPAVAEGIMTAELFKYNVALLRSAKA